MNLTTEWTLDWIENWIQNQKQTPHSLISFKHLKTTSSTNDDCKAILDDSMHFILAENQTQGRGRNKNKWHNSDFMASFTWKQKNKLSPHFSISLGEDFLKSFKNVWPHFNWTFKKPNDIYKDGQKVAGVLIETFPVQNLNQVIVGIGINVLNTPCVPHAGCIGFVHKQSWLLFLTDFFLKLIQLYRTELETL